MKKSNQIHNQALKLFSLHLGINADKILTSSNIYNDLGADSLDAVELLMACEEEFLCEISDAEAETVQTFGDAVTLLTELTQN
jgi:acyl carrier protein